MKGEDTGSHPTAFTAQDPGRSPGGAGPGHAPTRPAGGSSERPRPLRSHPESPHHGCRALLFRFARLGIRDPRRGPGFMKRSQGPGQGPLAPDAGREPPGCSSRGAREQALPALLLPGSRVPGAGGPGARVLSASSSFLLSPAPISPLAFKARGYSPD
ncbi:hypothetical protein J1605_014574 [Eschrichtius robustus]|uniref:Uncharacterized protein n=1 Tax=Eschrichtius robustus TaxID=9764 RepID=A0AB34GBH1_ESCRO|nr:hypothetical protein J1605_014574 [Eschrichtius robustus]